MTAVTASDIERRGVPRRTAYRWFSRLRKAGCYEEREVAVHARNGATHTAVALLVPDEVLATLPEAA
jgi:hypothetical protein